MTDCDKITRMFFSGKFVLDLMDYAASRGTDKNLLLETIQLPESQLGENGFVVDYDHIVPVFEQIKQQLNDPCFGMSMGEQINLRATAYLDMLMDNCATVQEAFELAIQYSRLISDSMECTLELAPDRFQVNFALNPDWSLRSDYAIAQNLDLALICTKNALQRLTQETHYPVAVNFQYPKPKHAAAYYRYFNCHLHFHAPVSSIVFSRHLLERSAVHKKHGLLEMLREEAKTLLDALPQESPYTMQVKKWILKDDAPAEVSIGDVAAALNLSPRTLQRRLIQENQTFQRIQQEVKFQLAKKLITSRGHNLDEVSFLLGYSDATAFVRAFRSWTGSSPKRYFREHR